MTDERKSEGVRHVHADTATVRNATLAKTLPTGIEPVTLRLTAARSNH